MTADPSTAPLRGFAQDDTSVGGAPMRDGDGLQCVVETVLDCGIWTGVLVQDEDAPVGAGWGGRLDAGWGRASGCGMGVDGV
jgi:hypothetical protein